MKRLDLSWVNQWRNWWSIRDSSQRVYQFCAYSFLFSWVLLLAFLKNATGEYGFWSSLYSLTIPLYYYLLFLLIFTLLLPIFWIKRLTPLVLVPKVLFDLVLIGDFFLFGVYRFHVDMVFINMLIHDFKGVGISVGLVLLSVAVGLLVIGINGLIYKYSERLPRLKLYRINFAVFVVFLVAQFTHVVAYEYRQVEYTKYTPYFPYYAPLTSASLMQKLKANYPETFPQVAESGTGQVASILTSGQQGLLSYPLTPLICEAEPEVLPNILIFVAESWRQDTLDNMVTPNIAAFAEQGTQFTNHYSGGNVTVNGLFSMLYGLHPTYRDYMTADPFKNQTLLTRTLTKLGYDIDVYTSSNLDRFSLKPLFFGDIADENYHNPLTGSTLENDRDAVSALLTDIKSMAGQKSAKPWFKFVFLSASHHNYQYPAHLEKFKPIETNPEKFLFNNDMDPQPLFNRYKNSVVYIDSLFGEIKTALEKVNAFDQTLTIVTSDHGEEFNDNQQGYWGHGSNFTQVQLGVPMIVNQPKSDKNRLPAKINRLSSHIDVVPTLLQQYAQCSNDLNDYSNGQNLFQLPEQRTGLIAASYKDKAYIINDFVYATGLSVESYAIKDLNIKNDDFDYGNLTKLKQQESHLLKH